MTRTRRLQCHLAFAYFGWILTGHACAETSDQKAIQAVYKRAENGARLKFVEGMLAHRAPDFSLFTNKNEAVDLGVERERFNRLFAPCTRIQLETRFLEWATGKSAPTCQIEQWIRLETVNPQTQQLETSTIHTVSIDEWKRLNGNWRLANSKILFISIGPSAPLQVDAATERKLALPKLSSKKRKL